MLQLDASGRSAVVLLQNVVGFLIALLLNQSLPGAGADALAGAAALGAAGRGGRDPVALHVRPAARPHQFVPDQSRACPTRASPGWPIRRPRMPAAIIAAVWKGFPFSTVVYLAALQNVDQEQIEAAMIDGAGPAAAAVRRRAPGDQRGDRRSTWC